MCATDVSIIVSAVICRIRVINGCEYRILESIKAGLSTCYRWSDWIIWPDQRDSDVQT